MQILRFNACAAVALAFTIFPMTNASADSREYQHGIDFIPSGNGGYWLLWSSSRGNPPKGRQSALLPDNTKCIYYDHDIYYSPVDMQRVAEEQRPLIRMPEAQEPVSSAISDEGTILVAFEDGSDSNLSTACEGRIQQRYQVFDSNLRPLSGIKTVAGNGAHSGHVAAVGSRFVIVYSQDWIDGGGVDNQGTGSDIKLDVVDNSGVLLHHRKIDVDNDDSRDWWPLVAASSKYAVIVWQQYVENSRRANLMFAVYHPSLNKLIKPATLLQSEVYYYHYDVQYLSGINRFIVVGNHLDDLLLPVQERHIPSKTQKGFAFLLDEKGRIVNRWGASHKCEICNSYHTHPFVREAQPAIYSGESHANVIYPVKPYGALMFSVSASRISLQEYVEDDYYWQSLGTDGIFLNDHTVLFATLSRRGLRTRILDLGER